MFERPLLLHSGIRACRTSGGSVRRGIVIFVPGRFSGHSIPTQCSFRQCRLSRLRPLLSSGFGYGMRTVIASAFVVSIFPVIANTLSGILSTDPARGICSGSMGRSRKRTRFFNCAFPAALPSDFYRTANFFRSGGNWRDCRRVHWRRRAGISSGCGADRQQRVDIKCLPRVLLASVLGLALFWCDQPGEYGNVVRGVACVGAVSGASSPCYRRFL